MCEPIHKVIMPYLSSKIIIAGTKHDRRIKLTPEDKVEIKELYKLPKWSQRGLAKKYGVSRRLIQFVLNPQMLEENKKRRAERGGSKQYYKKDTWKKVMREHRNYKQKLYIKGEI